MQSQSRYKSGDKIGGRYLVHQALMGGMGEVYLCLDLEMNLPYALKTFQQRYLTNPKLREAFNTEVATWVALEKHPNIVRCFYMQIIDNQPFMFLEWIAGEAGRGTDLRSWLWRGPLALRLALDFAIDICRGLVHAQQKQPGIVHRDLKPENILVTQGRLAKITDWGLAKIVQTAQLEISVEESETDGRQSLLDQDGIVGTPAYMAPEQWRGEELDARTDIYALGCVLYEMLTGHQAYGAPSFNGLRQQHLEADTPKLGSDQHWPGRLNTLLAHCLAKQRGERFASLNDLLDQLTLIYTQQFSESPKAITLDDAFTAMDYNNRGFTFKNLGRFAEALSDYNCAIELDQSLDAAYANRGNLNDIMGHHEEALADLSHAVELDANGARFYYDRGLVHEHMERYTEAVSDYTRAIESKPDDAKIYVNRSMVYIHLRHYAEALEDCNTAIRIDPHDAKAYGARGQASKGLGRHREAIVDFTRALELAPNEIWPYIGRASCYTEQGDNDKALTDYDHAIELAPARAEFYELRSRTHMKVTQYDKALADCIRAIELSQDADRRLYLLRSEIYSKLGRDDEAIADFNRTLGITLENADAHTYYGFGLAYSLRGFHQAALDAYSRAVELSQNDSEAALYYSARGIAHCDLGHFQEAASDLTCAIEFGQDDAHIHLARGEALIRLGRYIEALTDLDSKTELGLHLSDLELHFYRIRGFAYTSLERFQDALLDYTHAITLDPNDATLRLARADVLAQLGRRREALEDLDRAIESAPGLIGPHFARGLVNIDLGRYDEAYADFDEVISLDAASAQAYLYRAKVHAQLGRVQQALIDLSVAVRLDPASAESHLELGTIYGSEGRHGEALDEFSKAISLDPTSAEAHHNRGLAYAWLGQTQAAQADYRRAIELEPAYMPAYRNLGALLLNQGKLAEALPYYEKAEQLGDHQASQLAAEIRQRLASGEKPSALRLALSAFQNGFSLDAIRQAVAQYPFMTDASFIQLVEQIVEKAPPHATSVLRQRLAWLRQIANEQK